MITEGRGVLLAERYQLELYVSQGDSVQRGCAEQSIHQSIKTKTKEEPIESMQRGISPKTHLCKAAPVSRKLAIDLSFLKVQRPDGSNVIQLRFQPLVGIKSQLPPCQTWFRGRRAFGSGFREKQDF